jgi:hypothetical protein
VSWLQNQGPQTRQNVARTSQPSEETAIVVYSASSPTLQQTARGWLKSYDQNLSQNFWSLQDSPSGSKSPEGERLPPVATRTARRENFKKEHYATELDRIVNRRRLQQGNFKENAERGRTVSIDDVDVEREVTKVGCELAEVEQLMQSAASQHKNFRPSASRLGEQFRPRAPSQLEQQDLPKQDDQRAGSKELMKEPVKVMSKLVGRARKKNSQPRNPKWRVEERIKWARELLKENGERPEGMQKLPMTQFAVQGDHGKEEHALVDVQALQNRCKGLSSTCSAKSLLERERLREEEEAKAKKPVESKSQAEIDAFAALSWEDRLDIAQRRKLQGHVSGVFDKMYSEKYPNRKYPKDIPDSLLNHLHAMAAGDYTWHEGF